MSRKSKLEYLLSIRERYHKAIKEEKHRILDEFCEVCNYNRKYAIRILNRKEKQISQRTKKRGPKQKYNSPEIIKFLKLLWTSSNLICSKRLKGIIKYWLPWYEKENGKLSKETIALLRSISPATIDRLLSKFRSHYNKRGLCTTKPGGILRDLVPIKTDQE